MNELRPGLWTWTAPHPDWTPDQGGPEGWERDVRSYALDAGDCVVLFDPLVEASRVATLADRRPVVVLLTCWWHRRSTADLVRELDAVVHAPEADIAELGLAAEPYRLGDDLPGDVEPYPGGHANECTLWVRGAEALVGGDTFLGGGERGFRLLPDSWLDEGVTHEGIREALQPLLQLPVELLLPTHGDPVTDDAQDALRSAFAA